MCLHGLFYLLPCIHFTLYLTWTFAGHQPSSYQTYSDVKPTSRKPSIKSTILDGQALDFSLPGHLMSTKNELLENSIFSHLAKLHHTTGIKRCVSQDGFSAVLDLFLQAQTQNMNKKLITQKINVLAPPLACRAGRRISWRVASLE